MRTLSIKGVGNKDMLVIFYWIASNITAFIQSFIFSSMFYKDNESVSEEPDKIWSFPVFSLGENEKLQGICFRAEIRFSAPGSKLNFWSVFVIFQTFSYALNGI